MFVTGFCLFPMPLDITIEGKRKELLSTLSTLDIYSLPHFPIILGDVKNIPQFTHFHQFCFNFIWKDEVVHGLLLYHNASKSTSCKQQVILLSFKSKFDCTTTKPLHFDAGNEKDRDGGASKHRLPRVASGIFVTSNAAKIQPGTPTRFPISPQCKPFNPERVFNRSLQVVSFLYFFLMSLENGTRLLSV